MCEMVALAFCSELIRGCVIPGTALSGPLPVAQFIGGGTSVCVCAFSFPSFLAGNSNECVDDSFGYLGPN